jgi:prepilin peptidase CpaA
VIHIEQIAWWTSLVVLLTASATDLWSRRIPNWLVVPFLLAGLLARTLAGGMAGAWASFAGAALGCAFFALPCFLRAMGMGDLKLAAGVGAWILPGQLVTAMVVTALAGGVMAVAMAFLRGELGKRLDGAGNLAMSFARLRPEVPAKIGDASALAIPYAPAIAVGTLFSFFAR